MRRALCTAAIAIAVAVTAGCAEGDEPATTAPGPAAEPAETGGTTTEPAAPADGAGTGEGDGESETGGVAAESPGADPESALEAFFVSGDPDLVCGELATEELIASAYGDENGCRQAQVPGATPDAIKIERIETSGNVTDAIVIPEGGPNDGIETEVGLVLDGESWRVDRLEADVPAGP